MQGEYRPVFYNEYISVITQQGCISVDVKQEEIKITNTHGAGRLSEAFIEDEIGDQTSGEERKPRIKNPIPSGSRLIWRCFRFHALFRVPFFSIWRAMRVFGAMFECEGMLSWLPEQTAQKYSLEKDIGSLNSIEENGAKCCTVQMIALHWRSQAMGDLILEVVEMVLRYICQP